MKDATISTLSSDVRAKLQALKGLKSRLLEIQEYMDLVAAGKLPINHDITNFLQVGGGGEGGRVRAQLLRTANRLTLTSTKQKETANRSATQLGHS